MLSRLKGEISYTKDRFCLRNYPVVQRLLTEAHEKIEEALKHVEANPLSKDNPPEAPNRT